MARLVARFGLTRYEADEEYRIALDFFSKDDLKKAVEHIDLAISMNPSRAEYYAARGLFRMEDGLPRSDIESDFDEALKRNQYEMLANYSKGILEFNDGNYQTAHDYFMKAWAVQQERPETLYYLSLTTHRLNNNQHALGWMTLFLEKMNALDPSKSDLKKSDFNKRIRNAEQWVKVYEKLLKKEAKTNPSPISINPDR